MKPDPPIHISEETHRLIRETWIRDCKELACFHKCFLQLPDFDGYGLKSDDEQSDDEQSVDEQSDDEQSDDEQSDDGQSDDGQSDDGQSDDEQSDNEQSDDEQSDDEQSDHKQSDHKKTYYGICFIPCSYSLNVSNLEDFQPLKKELLSNLESLIPGYFNQLSPSASDEDKYNSLVERLDEAWMSFPSGKTSKGSEDSELFHRTLARVLSKDRFQRLAKADLPRDLEGGTPTLLQKSLEQVLNQLSKSIEGEQATFSCGGSITIDPTLCRGTDTSDTPLNVRSSPPVTIYWSGDNELLYKVSLPHEKKSSGRFDQLLADCTPVTVGLRDTDGLDNKSYQHVGALDADRFSTNFHPADFGIIDSIEQLLLPRINSTSEGQFEFRRIRTELNELNVHSATPGISRKHAHTQRSRDLFGFLVVCLPSIHEGGPLSIHHNEKRVIFDWSHLSASSIQWAAFYSDCEHEIGQIVNGHLITLTYNLYVTEPIGGPLIQNPIVDETSFPLYEQFKAALENPGFFKDGGVLGAFCSRPYPHTSEGAASGFPKALKGTDMALFSVLRSLGLEVKVLPVLETDGNYTVNPKLNSSSSDPERSSHLTYLQSDFGDECDGDEKWKKAFDHFQKTGKMIFNEYQTEWGEWRGQFRDVETSFHLKYRRLFNDYNGAMDLESYWKILLLARLPKGLGRPVGSRVGHHLHPYVIWDKFAHNDDSLLKFWPSSFLPGITWLSSPKHQARAMTYLHDYNSSNKPLTEKRYSCLAIIAVVPPSNERDLSIY